MEIKVILFSALKAENMNVKKELEDLRREARSTFMAHNGIFLHNINLRNLEKFKPITSLLP